MNVFLLILGCLISGVVGGMGMGGGTLLIPILVIFFGFVQQSAQGLNLFVFLPMSIVAIVLHIKNKLVNFKVGIPIIISGVITSIFGSLIANRLDANVLRKCFGIFLLLVGVFQIIQTIKNIKSVKDKYNFKFKIVMFKKF